jgi:hypothetical protein
VKTAVTLESMAPCFQGLLPSQFLTCSRDGVPNAAYLSHVDYVDPQHVALSFQFFNKSRRNISENPNAAVMVSDPDTGQGWTLRLRYVRSETSGPLFERMSLRIEAIASYCGLKGVFRLRAADVYEVLSIDPVPEETGLVPVAAGREPGPDAIFTMNALQDLASRIQSSETLDTLVDSMLEGLEACFGFRQSMILVPSEEGVLVTIATRGYPDNGVGAEVRAGEGIAGMVAEARKPIRISGLLRPMLYALAMHRASEAPDAGRSRFRIPLPGLPNPESQLGLPLLVRGELVGVLCLESEVPYRFHEEDKATIELLGSYLAIAMQNIQLQERSAEVEAEDVSDRVAMPSSAVDRPRRAVIYDRAEECVLVDGEYLIRGLPARILWYLLSAHDAAGRVEFTNRELRLVPSLNLPEWKDSLESRLLMLRRRLQQKVPDIQILPRGRGRFALEVGCTVTLSTRS